MNAPRVIPVKNPDPVKSIHPSIHPNLPQIEGFGGGATHKKDSIQRPLLVKPLRMILPPDS